MNQTRKRSRPEPSTLTGPEFKPNTLNGTHTIQLLDFPLMDYTVGGKVEPLPTFDLVDHKWGLSIYPGGCTPKTIGQVAIFLKYLSNNDECLRTVFTLEFLDSKCNVLKSLTGCAHYGPEGKEGVTSSRGWLETMPRSELIGKLPDLTLGIRVTVLLFLPASAAPQTSQASSITPLASDPDTRLECDMFGLLNTDWGKDMTIRVFPEENHTSEEIPSSSSSYPPSSLLHNAPTEIKVHSVIMYARSNYFKALLGSGMKEGSNKIVDVKGVDPTDFSELIHFIYTSNMRQRAVDRAEHLVVVAERFQMDDAKAFFESALIKSLSKDNCLSYASLADTHGCSELRARCIRVISDNYLDLHNDPSYSYLDQHLKDSILNEAKKCTLIPRLRSVDNFANSAPEPKRAKTD